MIGRLTEIGRFTRHRTREVLEATGVHAEHAAAEALGAAREHCFGRGGRDPIERGDHLACVGVAQEAHRDVPLRSVRPAHAGERRPRKRLERVEHLVGRPHRHEEPLAQACASRSAARSSSRSRIMLSEEITAN